MGRQLAREAARAGARVAMLDRNPGRIAAYARELRSEGLVAAGIVCDVSDAESVERAAHQAEAELGPCDALVNCAGVMRPAALSSLDLSDWNQVLATNLTGYLNTSRAFARQMMTQGEGTMVHVASVASWFPQSSSGAYSASKAAVRLLSQQLALEWADHSIRSNTVSPGMIRTKLTESFYQHPGVEERRAAMTASRRVGKASDIADAILFLLSPRSAYVNATDLLVDGGMTAMLMDGVPRPGFNEEGSA